MYILIIFYKKKKKKKKLKSAVKSKLNSNGIDNADELSIKFTEMLVNGHSKEEVISELEKYSKLDERRNKTFVDWLFGYTSVISSLRTQQSQEESPLTEADTEPATEAQTYDHQTNTAPIEDVTEEDDEEDKEFSKNEEGNTVELEEEKTKITGENVEEDADSDASDDVPELQSKESDDEQEPKTEVEKDTEEPKEEEKKPEVPKRRSFIRIKEGKSGRFTPIKSEDRHSYVKRNLTRHATQLDVANQVQKKMKSHADAVQNAYEKTLNKKQSNASINSNGLDKKKSFRRDSNASNASSAPSFHHSANPTFIQYPSKTFQKVNKTSATNINTSTVTPEQSKAVRCTYWPNCNRGNECKFWHPKELCPNLNNCPYGDECLYIHPAIPQSQLNKKNKKKSESSIEVSETTKHTVQKKLSKRESIASITSNSSQSKKSIKNNTKEFTANGAANNTYAIECKFGANCTRVDCKYSHPSPAAILAANSLKKKESGKLKEKKSHDLLKHKESRSSTKSISIEEAQTILVNN